MALGEKACQGPPPQEASSSSWTDAIAELISGPKQARQLRCLLSGGPSVRPFPVPHPKIPSVQSIFKVRREKKGRSAFRAPPHLLPCTWTYCHLVEEYGNVLAVAAAVFGGKKRRDTAQWEVIVVPRGWARGNRTLIPKRFLRHVHVACQLPFFFAHLRHVSEFL